MAKKAAAGQSGVTDFDDETYYQVTLLRATKYAERTLPPGAKITVKGKVAKLIQADIANATKANTT